MGDEPREEAVFENTQVAKYQGLAQHDRYHREIHGVAHVAIEAADHEALGGKYGGGCAHFLKGEAGEGLEQDCEGRGDPDQAYDTQRGKAWERGIGAPS